ncbi:thioredoxin family protein [Sphingobacterium sp. UBA1498]|uniref:thioredoxin family protein n=1 Tax=Sphingobacterium sp. UBA1498 TaxID=1947481 RepID=UPI0039C96390
MRKTILLISILSGFCIIVLGQNRASGIIFFKGNFKEALAVAQQKKLPVFVDVYTDWCAPCRRMEQEVFLPPGGGCILQRALYLLSAGC